VTALKLRAATRKSPLALAQTRWVAARIAERFDGPVEVEEIHVVTKGDKVLDQPLAKIGGKGLFISEVEATLGRGEADLAIHSMKDVPDALAEGMVLAGMPEREDPRDVLVSPGGTPFEALPTGARIGTSSLRRACQLKAARPDLRFGVLRGNVGTRLSKLDGGSFDAIVLAYAGLKRLGLDAHRKLAPLDPRLCVPAVGQGALGIEVRGDDATARAAVALLEDATTRVCVEAERAFLGHLQGSCTTPLAAHARLDGDRLHVVGMVGAVDASQILKDEIDGTLGQDRVADAVALGSKLGAMLAARGGADLVKAAQAAEDPYVLGPYA
jgi:hydroxymethylbilane synthase